MRRRKLLLKLSEYGAILLLGGALGWGALSAWQRINPTSPIRNGDFSRLLQAQQTDLVLFSSTRCKYCVQAKAYLEQHEIRYELLEIDQSSAALDWYREVRGNGVPLLVKKNQALIGFDEQQFAEFLLAE